MTPTLALLAVLAQPAPVQSNGHLAFTEDGQLLVGSDQGEFARYWVPTAGNLTRYHVGEGPVRHLASGPRPSALAAATQRAVLVVDQRGAQRRVSTGFDIIGLGFVENAIVVGQANGVFKSWDMATSSPDGHRAAEGRAVAAAFAAGRRDGAMLFADGRLVVVQFDERTQWTAKVKLGEHSGQPLVVTRTRVVALDDGGATLFDRVTGRPTNRLQPIRGRIVHLAASPDHQLFLTTTDLGHTEVHSERGDTVRSFSLEAPELPRQALGIAGRTAAIPTRPGQVILQDVMSGKHLTLAPRPDWQDTLSTAIDAKDVRVSVIEPARRSITPGRLRVRLPDPGEVAFEAVVLLPMNASNVSLVPVGPRRFRRADPWYVDVSVTGDAPSGPLPTRLMLWTADGTGYTAEVTLPVLAPDPRVAAVSSTLDDVLVRVANDGDLDANLLVDVSWVGKQQRFELKVAPGADELLRLPAGSFFAPGDVVVELLDARWPTFVKRSEHTGVGTWRPWKWVGLVGGFIAVMALFFVFLWRGVVSAAKRMPQLSLDGTARMDPMVRLYRRAGVELLEHAGLPRDRWERAVKAAGDPESTAAAFADALGRTLGDREGQHALWRFRLPPLRLRFPRDIHLAVLTGGQLDGGEARALAETVADAPGSPRCIVLDRTRAQNAKGLLASVPRAAFVVANATELRDLLFSDDPMVGLQHLMSAQLPRRELSPYRLAGGVEEDMLFFGRAEEIRRIVDRPEWRNAFVIAPRQMGKTSLLKAAARRATQRDDVEVRFLTLDHADLVGRLAHELGVPRPEGPDAFRELAAGDDKPRLWLLDEVDPFVAQDARDGYPISRVMRSLSAEGRAYFVLTGLWDLYAAAVLDPDHPLRNFAERILLGPLDDAAARELATRPMRDLAIEWAPDAVDHLLEQTGRRPNLMVIACRELIESLAPDTSTLTLEHTRAVLRPDGELANELKYWRRQGPTFRAAFFTGLALINAPRSDILDSLRGGGIDLSETDADELFDRLRLSYVLVPDADGRMVCPIPLLRAFVARSGDPSELAAREIQRAALGVTDSPAPTVAPLVDDDEIL